MPQPDDVLVLPLDADDATTDRVGGKGASLARLAHAGLPVPAGFHVTTAAYRRFIDANDLRPRILAVAAVAPAAGAIGADPVSLERAAGEIADLFARGAIPEDVSAAIRDAYRRLGDGTAPAVAVRSSATAEDLPDLSFAGQQATFLNVRGAAAVVEAVRRCWASLWTARAIGYRLRHGIPNDDVALAAVVQELVEAETAGVLFTTHPVSGEHRTLIDAAWGLGESVVGGLVTPDSLTVDPETGDVLDEVVADKTTMIVPDGDGTRVVPVPAPDRDRPALTAAEAAELTRLGARIERLWDRPMDVEWAVRAGRPYILQARPITALPAPARMPASWPVPDPRAKYYRTSVIELLPDPVSPLFATLALPRWNAALAELIGSPNVPVALTTINGYAYYETDLRLAVFLRLLPPAIELVTGIPRAVARWEHGARPAYAAAARHWEGADLAAKPATALVDDAAEVVTVAARHYLAIQSSILPAAYISEALFSAVYERFIRRRADPPALTFLLGQESAPLRAEASLWRLAGQLRGAPVLAAWLAATAGREVAARLDDPAPPDGVAPEAWRSFTQALRAHLARFGHTVYDLDFARPVPADDPVPVIDQLRRFVSGDAPDPVRRRREAAAAAAAATARMRSRLRNPRRALFRRLLPPARRYGPLREDALADVGLGWPVLRRMLREIGRRLVAAGAIDAADDVFWLTVDELRDAARRLDAGAEAVDRSAAVAERQRRAAEEARLTPPPFLPPASGATFLGVDWSRWMPAREAPPDGLIRGTGTSPGRVTSTARIVHGPEDFDRLQPGEILVTRITTPAWTPLFALAAGVVTDVGGPLSHGSIVAREYGIPAVLGTGVATARLASGDRITVDGDAGSVVRAS